MWKQDYDNLPSRHIISTHLFHHVYFLRGGTVKGGAGGGEGNPDMKRRTEQRLLINFIPWSSLSNNVITINTENIDTACSDP